LHIWKLPFADYAAATLSRVPRCSRYVDVQRRKRPERIPTDTGDETIGPIITPMHTNGGFFVSSFSNASWTEVG
jgi:hypothetical protein